MRGSPPLQLALLLIGFLLLSVPLIQLTSARKDGPVTATPPVATATDSAVPTRVRVMWAHLPSSLSLLLDGKPLLSGQDLSMDKIAQGKGKLEASTALLLPREGIEINVQAEWPAGTPDTAVSVTLEPDERDAQSITRWSSAERLQDIYPFQWK